MRDLEDRPVASGFTRSLVALGGLDLGDWVVERSAGILLNWKGGRSLGGQVGLSVEDRTSLATGAGPLAGRFRPNPALGSGTVGVIRTAWSGGDPGPVMWRVEGEAGTGSHEYVRIGAELDGRRGPLSLAGRFGWGSRDLPVARSLVLGGWGTLEGEGFRRFGGRRTAVLESRYDFHISGPPLPWVRGRYAPAIRISPFAAVGWAGGNPGGVPWEASDGARPVVGLSFGLAGDLLGVRVGWGLRSGRLGASVDIDRAFWPLL